MLTRIPAILSATIVVIWITAAGCVPEQVATTEMVEVHGTILVDGKPLNQAKVVFVPDGAQLSRRSALSYGTTDAQGKFQLKQRDETPGALTAGYRVYVSKREPHAGQDERFGNARLDDDGLMDTETIPQFYNRYTELRYDVVSGHDILQPEFKLSTIDPLLKRD